MGRTPKSIESHKLNGSYRPDRHGFSEPEIDGTLAKPEMGEAASWCWDQISPQLEANGAGAADAPLVIRLCEWWATAEACQRRIERGKFEYKDLCAMSMASKHIEKLCAMLGLSPTDRLKLRVQKKEPSGPKLSDYKLA